MGPLLIDDLGNVWSCYATGLERSLGLKASDAQFGDYAVVTRGFVEIRPFARGSEVRLNPSKVSQKAMGTLLYWLRDCAPGSVVLSTFDAGWKHELIADQRQLRDDLMRCADSSPMPAGPFLLRSREPSGTPVGRLIPNLRAALQDARNVDELRSASRCFLGARFTFFCMPPTGSRLVFAEMGEGYRNPDISWQRMARGLTLEDIGDYYFGRWLAEAHHRVLAANEPIVEDVDALVEWPGRGRVRTRYERLILPFAGPDRSQWLLSTSTLRDDIDLRVEAGDEPG